MRARAALFVLRKFRSLHRHPGATVDEVRRFRDEQLRRVIAHAYRAVPHYRRLFVQHGVLPEDVRTVEDLRRIPITTRATLQSLPAHDVVAAGSDPSRFCTHTTSGSSGRPLTIRRSWVEERLLIEIRLRAMRAYGLAGSETVALIKTPAHGDNRGLLMRLVQLVRPDRWHLIDCALEPAEIAARIRALGPAVVVGYPGVLARVAQVVDPAKLRMPGLRFVTTGGEVLAPSQRAQIADAFGTRVYDTYGSFEFDLLAWECPASGGYHVADDGIVLEVLRDGRPVAEGECGEVVGTALHSYAMPFIRFALGDVVRRGPAACSCGQPFSTIGEIHGRVVDCFRLPDGRVVHPYAVFIPIRTRAPWIRHFQVIQTRADYIVMRAVASPPPSTGDLALVRGMMETAFGPRVQVALELVAELPFEPSGKLRTYRSLVWEADARRADRAPAEL